MSQLIVDVLRAKVGTLSEAQIRACLLAIGVLKHGHFVYHSRKHGEIYWAKDILFLHALLTERLCRELAFQMRDPKVQAVVAPAHGGVILSGLVAQNFERQPGEGVTSFFAEKPIVPGPLAFKRGYGEYVSSGKKVLAIVADAGDGTHACALVDAIRILGGDVVGLAVLSNRRNLDTMYLRVPAIFVPRGDYLGRYGLAQTLPQPRLIENMCSEIARRFASGNVQTVAGLAPEGSFLAHLVARHLTIGGGMLEEVNGVYAEYPTQDMFALDPDVAKMIKGMNIAVVEDVLNTGKALGDIIRLVQWAGGNVVRAGALVVRQSALVTAETLGVPALAALLKNNDEAWEAPCKLCLADPPVRINTDFGKGADFLREQAAAQAGK
jgi:orotate phosphoribosyltransferase